MSDPDKPHKTKWFHDHVSPDLIQLHSIKRVIYSGRTEFQAIDIVATGSFGVCLILDGKIQSSERDEFIYHEALVQPPMITHPRPEKVFIAGGGEGATLREVLAHRIVNEVVMVDIDKQVIDVCRQFLPSFHQNSFDDPRAELHFTDARKYLEQSNDKFDVIIIDLADPLEGGPAYLLYTQEFYNLAKEKLTSEGIMSVQAGPAGWTSLENFTAVVSTLKSVFPVVCPYQTHVPSFADLWGFASASQSLNPTALSSKEIDRRISERLSKKLEFYDGLTHQNMFALPKHLRHQIAITKQVITDKKPIFTY